VKIRGFRIELGEIESVLASHDEVAAVAVTVLEDADAPADKRLVAYVVPGPGAGAGAGSGLDAQSLRGWCEQQLPDYMVPGWFVFLDALPLTANGKLDHAALPEPGGEGEGPAGSSTAPRTEFEAALAGIWTDVLRLERIGVHDDFFDLGGHSLLAMQVVNRISLLTGLQVSVKEFFGRPTVEALAQYVLELFAAEDADQGA
jgi:acyl carrier protein